MTTHVPFPASVPHAENAPAQLATAKTTNLNRATPLHKPQGILSSQFAHERTISHSQRAVSAGSGRHPLIPSPPSLRARQTRRSEGVLDGTKIMGGREALTQRGYDPAMCPGTPRQVGKFLPWGCCA